KSTEGMSILGKSALSETDGQTHNARRQGRSCALDGDRCAHFRATSRNGGSPRNEGIRGSNEHTESADAPATGEAEQSTSPTWPFCAGRKGTTGQWRRNNDSSYGDTSLDIWLDSGQGIELRAGDMRVAGVRLLQRIHSPNPSTRPVRHAFA